MIRLSAELHLSRIIKLENPQALSQLIELCVKSKMIAEQVARYPILLDELLDRQSLLNPPDFYAEDSAQLRQYMCPV